MFIARFEKTMAKARPVQDAGINLRPTPRRDSVIEASHRWLAEQQARRKAAVEKAIEQLLAYDIRQKAQRENCYRPSLKVEVVPFTSASDMIKRVAAWHPDVTVADIKSAGRFRRIVAARYDAIAAVYLNCRHFDGTRYSLPEVGRFFGKRDHTTVLHALRSRGIDTSWASRNPDRRNA